MTTMTTTTKKIRDYGLTILVREDAPQELIDGLTKKVKRWSKGMKFEDWGVKRLAYPIRNQEKGHYLFYTLGLTEDKPVKISNDFNLNDDVMRYLLVRVNNKI